MFKFKHALRVIPFMLMMVFVLLFSTTSSVLAGNDGLVTSNVINLAYEDVAFAEPSPTPGAIIIQPVTPEMPTSSPTPTADVNGITLESAVFQAAAAYLTLPNNAMVSDIQLVGDWAFGFLVIPASEENHENPELILFLGQKRTSGWDVDIEYSPEFDAKLEQSPTSFMSNEARAMLLQDPSTMGDGSSQLSLPFATGETWTLTSGPHQGSDSDPTNQGALDFQYNTSGHGIVRAAREGTVWRASSCPNFIRVDHADGWQTGYYHLVAEVVGNGQWVNRGQHLANEGMGTGCGGSADGPHVHFSLRRSGVGQSWYDKDLGGWTVTGTTRAGCMTRISDGVVVCQWGRVYNNGCIGSCTFPDPPQDSNLIQNSDFSAGFQHWWFGNGVDRAINNGILHFKRRTDNGDGYTGQSINYKGPANSTFEVTLHLGNTSGVTKYPAIILRNSQTWDNAIRCDFIIPPNTPLQPYVVRGRTPGSTWPSMTFEVWADPQDGIPDTIMDNVALFWRPTLNIPGTQCFGPSSQTAWDFSGNNGPQGWTIVNSLALPTQHGEGMWYRVTGGDPYIEGPGLQNISATNYPYIRVRMASLANNCGEIYFRTQGDGGFTGEKFVSFAINADGATRDYLVDMSSNSLWTGNVIQIRLDPSCGYDSSRDNGIRIDRIEFTIPAQIAINNVTRAEGNSGTTAFTFTVSLNEASPQTVTVNYATSNGTATAGSDYTATNGTLTFAPGETSKTVTVNVTGETATEADETFTVNLSSPTNATIADAQGVGTITNDDGWPSMAISNVTLTEGNSATKAFSFAVSLTSASQQTITVNYATSDGTATAGSDYTATNGTLTFAPGETSKTVTVNVTGETVHELHETFNVNLSGVTNATLADNLGVGTISNDDARPTIRVNDLSRTEGGVGVTTNIPFTVTLSNPSYQTITVQFLTSDGSASAGSDYTAFATTTLSFAPGVTTRNVTVQVTGDNIHEQHETLYFNLMNPTNASILDAQGMGTIANDDGRPTIRVNDLSRTEGGSGVTTNVPFTVTLSNPSDQTITVQFATSDGTATAGSDYTGLALTTLSFTPGVTTRNVTVNVNGDASFEPHETFNFHLSNSVNAVIADNLGVGTIANDDSKPSLRINDITVSEGNSGTKAFTFTVSLTAPSGVATTVNYVTANGTAIAGSDYTSAIGTLTLNSGESSKSLTVMVMGDTLFEGHETFMVNLSGATNALIADAQGMATITNDDAASLGEPLVLTPASATVNEGESTTYTLALSAAPAELLDSESVSVALIFDAAYLTVSPATVTFDATNWNTPQTVTVTAVDDQQAAQQSISLPILHTLTSGDASLNGAPFGVTINDNDVLLVPVAPELPQMEAVAPVSPDAPDQPQPVPTEATPLMPAGAATGSPVMFMWRAASGASSYSLHITTEAGELVYEGVFSAAADCAGEICQALPDVTLNEGINYLWSVQADAQPRSFALSFTYTPTNFSPIVNP